MVELRDGERIDDLQAAGYRIIQHPARFCFGTDAVLLAHFAHGPKDAKWLDLGTGTGILPLLIAAHRPFASFQALEIQPEAADMAARSMELNGPVRAHPGHLRKYPGRAGALRHGRLRRGGVQSPLRQAGRGAAKPRGCKVHRAA